MSIKAFILLALTNLTQAWWSKCELYKDIHDFCALLFPDEECNGRPMVVPQHPSSQVCVITKYVFIQKNVLKNFIQKYEVPNDIDDKIQSLVVNRNCELSLYRHHGCIPQSNHGYWGITLKNPLDKNRIIKEIEDEYYPLNYFDKNIRCVRCKCLPSRSF